MSYRLRVHFGLLLLILVGFAIRVYLLNDVTLSPDERNVTNEFLRISLLDLLTATTKHGFPEHLFAGVLIWFSYLLGWQLFLLRWPGIFFSVLTLAVTFKLTKKMLGSPSALAATFLLTLSYYHLLFTHQIRGYAEMVFFAVISFYFLWQAMQTQRWRDWMFFALAAGFGIYNQFFAFTLLATQGIIIAVWLALRAVQQRLKPALFLRRQVVPPLTAGVGSILLAGLLFAPMLPQFFRNFVAADSDFAVASGSVTAELFPYYYLFFQYSGALSAWNVLLYLSLILAGAIYLLRIRPSSAGVLLGWLIIPLLIVVLGQIYISWFYVRERYLIYMLPAFIILAGAGWVSLLRLSKRISDVVEVGFFGVSLIVITTMSMASISHYLKLATLGNWEETSNFLATKVLPTDLVVCEPFAHGWKEIDLDPADECTRNINYRLKQQTDVFYPVYNLYAVATYNSIAENPILLQRNPRLWVIMWNLPGNLNYQGVKPAASFHRLGHTIVLGPFGENNVIASFIQALTQVNALTNHPSTRFALLTRLADLNAALGQTKAATESLARAREVIPSDQQARNQVTMIEQHLNQPPLTSVPDHVMTVDLGDQIRFSGYSLSPIPVAAGQTSQLQLFWQSLASVDQDYSIFLHLRNEANQTVAQLDIAPERPTSGWWVGDVLQDKIEFQLPAHLPAGNYRLLVGLYNLQTLERLSVKDDQTGENAIELTRFVISD